VTRAPWSVRPALLVVAVAALISADCGKKGPPLPPLVQLPVAPSEFSVVRRGPRADVSFRIPNANSDRSTPADLTHVDVFAWDVPGLVSADEVVTHGTRVRSIVVNKPADDDDPPPSKSKSKSKTDDAKPRKASSKKTPARPDGVDQNTVVTISDDLSATTASAAGTARYRAYVAVGFNRRGRRGVLSTRVAMPLVPPPPPPGDLRLTYDEKAITVSWAPVAAPTGTAKYAYSVYRPDPLQMLSDKPLTETRFADPSVEWEKERCYEVRAVATVEGVRIEGAASPARCVTLHDTFPPEPPTGLVGVGSESAVSLIWTASPEADLAGYIVLRAIDPATDLAPITPAPIPDTNFRDTVPTGSRVTYAIEAVDKNGNRSKPSDRITEIAR
jgi:hypothetical protein